MRKETGMETTMATTMEPRPVAGLLLAKNPPRKKQLPRTRAEFILAAKWLAERAILVVETASSLLLAGKDKDDEEMGVCRGYLDGRDWR